LALPLGLLPVLLLLLQLVPVLLLKRKSVARDKAPLLLTLRLCRREPGGNDAPTKVNLLLAASEFGSAPATV
jgi:hypothetical protein